MVQLAPLNPKNDISYEAKRNGSDYVHVTFTNSSEAVRAVRQGYIEIDGVTVELSEEAKKELEKSRERFDQANAASMIMDMAQHNAEVARQQAKAEKEGFNDLAKAIETARRISKGGKVPPRDEQKLMEFDSTMYQTAKLAAMNAKKHKKYKSQYKDDEEDNDSSSRSSGSPVEGITDGAKIEMDVSLGSDTPEVTDVTP